MIHRSKSLQRLDLGQNFQTSAEQSTTSKDLLSNQNHTKSVWKPTHYPSRTLQSSVGNLEKHTKREVIIMHFTWWSHVYCTRTILFFEYFFNIIKFMFNHLDHRVLNLTFTFYPNYRLRWIYRYTYILKNQAWGTCLFAKISMNNHRLPPAASLFNLLV